MQQVLLFDDKGRFVATWYEDEDDEDNEDEEDED